MDSLILAINVVLPLLIMILIGQVIQKRQIVDEHSLQQINRLVFQLFLPCVLFVSILKTDLQVAFQPKLLLYLIAAVFVTVLAAAVVMPKITADKHKQAVLVMNSYRSNFVLFGIPIVQMIYGDGALGATSMAVAVLVPLFNILSVIVLSFYSGRKFNVRRVVIDIFKNPLIVATILGFACLLLRIELPTVILRTVTDLSKVATPLALIILGATFHMQDVSANLRELITMVLTRLVIVPMVFLGGGVLLGFRGPELILMLAAFASPCAVSSYSMAVSMGADGELASQGLLMTTVGCIITIFLWIFMFSQFGLL